ncbi:hypothetical protein QYE76_062221 [Lolium multiflorum]|uniref:Uncharacterized protein n=1 Tax=Lolium multiflorum TaxID=4521 RepID=A0AAD8W5F9_LOLMU|nr:hypothetical protein QYE76_062221 [Lolium multiflorum]
MASREVLMLEAPPAEAAGVPWRAPPDAETVDALPYIDGDYGDPAVKREVDRLVEEEMRRAHRKPASAVPMALEKFKTTHKKQGFYMVHCWDKLKEAAKWMVVYAAYHEAVKNGTATLVIDGEDEDSGQKALPPRPRGHKATKAGLTREASALALSQTLEKIMVESQAVLAKRDEKSSLEKEGSIAIYLNLTKEAIEVQRMDAEAKKADAEAKMLDAKARRMDAEAKIRAEDTRIMLADLATMDDDTRPGS